MNENDSIATEEIAFGDNDVLATRVASLVGAELVINLSNVNGFYLKDGSRVREVVSEKEIDRSLISHLDEKSRELTVGGMGAKLRACRVPDFD